MTSGNNSGVGDGAKKGPHPLVKSESMKEPGLSHKTFASVDQKGLRRERSGSVKNELGNYVRGPSGEVLSPISQTEEDSLLGRIKKSASPKKFTCNVIIRIKVYVLRFQLKRCHLSFFIDCLLYCF